MENSSDIRTGRHCVFNLHVHLVFVTKYRRSILQKHHYDELQKIFTKVCKNFESDLVEIDGKGDHVHLLVNYPPKVSISKLVNSLKGVSSRLLRKKFSDLHHCYWKGVLWSSSYYAGSCGGAPISIIRQYIEKQQY